MLFVSSGLVFEGKNGRFTRNSGSGLQERECLEPRGSILLLSLLDMASRLMGGVAILTNPYTLVMGVGQRVPKIIYRVREGGSETWQGCE